jgi:hypothetical protein
MPEKYQRLPRLLTAQFGEPMNWNAEHHHLSEQLEILKKLRARFGEEAIEIASQARLDVHNTWIQRWSQNASGRPSDIFNHSAFGVTSADESLLEYEVLEDSDEKFEVCITQCKYAEFYIAQGEPKIGYAMHCALDFGEAAAYSPDIILKRTKTLMRGDRCCNHCYERLRSRR